MSTNSQAIIAEPAPNARLSLVEQRRELLAILDPDPSYMRVEGLLDQPDRFRQWLIAKPAREIVGFPESLFSCPIANYLAAGGINHPVVGDQMLRWNYDEGDPRAAPRYLLPTWAARFVTLIDSTWKCGDDITAARALAALSAVTSTGGAA